MHGEKTAMLLGLLLPLMVMTSGCRFLPGATQPAVGQASGRSGRPGGGGRPGQADDGPVAVQTARAETGFAEGALTYTGTTRPNQQVALRSQVSGEITSLSVDVGDAVSQGDLLAQLDGNLQTTSLNQAQAELSAQAAAAAQAEVSIRDAQASVVQAQATLDQARIDAARLKQLAEQGAIAQQDAEAAALAVTNAQQALLSAQAQVAAQRQAVAAADNQADAQQAVLAQRERQLSYADLRSPLTGVVLAKQAEVGDFIESGTAVLELGDLSTLEVTVQVSELDIAKLRVGQPARITLDAFASEGSILGEIEQISPVADPVSRLIPVQVSIPNVNRRVGSGQLARVQFSAGQQPQVVVPESALSVGEGVGERENVVFVVEGEGEERRAVMRSVRIGQRAQGRVTILSGLAVGEDFVVKSDRPLSDGQAVRLSILSESVN